MEEVEAVLYDQLIEQREPERLDADQRELLFAQGLNLETLNPRTRAQFAFEWGLPDYMSLVGDYEHQLRRDLSVHAGFRRRYTGWNFETGVRWALIKSSRTKTLLVLMYDFHFNMNHSLWVCSRTGFGKKFEARLQVLVQTEVQKYASPRLLSGINFTYHAADQVSVFGETTLRVTW